MKLRIAKGIFWFFAGLGLTIFILRVIHGPGSVTVLSDIIPWGLWKGGGVVALVAVGGAGFTLAMFVYIFRWEQYKPLVSGAVLLALLCYSSVAIGLTIDIGIWWRIVFPVFHWQFHSVLFEVAWCIMLYLGVLMFEFSHTALEKFGLQALLSIVKKLTIVFVIAGISLSTLHQSSLGTLFLASPFRLHPLWYTDFLPLLFFISSIAVGCMTITVVVIFVYWLYNAEPPMKAIAGIGRVSAVLMAGYLVLKLVEIVAAGEAALMFQGSWDTFNFWFEILLSSLIPIYFLSQKKYTENKTAMFWIGTCAAIGICLNRVNVAGLATLTLTGSDYLPNWTEWALMLGVLSGAALAYLFCVEYFGLFKEISKSRIQEKYEPGHLDHTDWGALFFGSQRFGEARFYSFSFIMAIALSFLFFPDDAVFGVSPEKTEIYKPRVVRIAKSPEPESSRIRYTVCSGDKVPGVGGERADVFMIDGNRDGRYVLFDHEMHIKNDTWNGGSCTVCHHMKKPFDKASSCYECHSDMYMASSIFDHGLHVKKLGGNDHCSECHTDPELPKVMENTTDCLACHKGMRLEGSLIKTDVSDMNYVACGYMDAMHGLCIGCHKDVCKSLEQTDENLAGCTNCHRCLPKLDAKEWENQR